MKKKQWYIKIDFDDGFERSEQVHSWAAGLLKILEVIKKDIPFYVTLDFFFTDGDKE